MNYYRLTRLLKIAEERDYPAFVAVPLTRCPKCLQVLNKIVWVQYEGKHCHLIACDCGCYAVRTPFIESGLDFVN